MCIICDAQATHTSRISGPRFVYVYVRLISLPFSLCPLSFAWWGSEKDLCIIFDTVTDAWPGTRGSGGFICCFIRVSAGRQRAGQLSQIGYFLIGISHSLGLVLTGDVVLTACFPLLDLVIASLCFSQPFQHLYYALAACSVQQGVLIGPEHCPS